MQGEEERGAWGGAVWVMDGGGGSGVYDGG